MRGDRTLDDETLRRRAAKVFGDDGADDVIDAYSQSRPGASPAPLPPNRRAPTAGSARSSQVV
jgi:hypothetical protein